VASRPPEPTSDEASPGGRVGRPTGVGVAPDRAQNGAARDHPVVGSDPLPGATTEPEHRGGSLVLQTAWTDTQPARTGTRR
jgi:hypothetical protein